MRISRPIPVVVLQLEVLELKLHILIVILRKQSPSKILLHL
jgi:hypothetical protein